MIKRVNRTIFLVIILLIIVTITISFICPSSTTAAIETDLSCRSALLMDFDSGEILFSVNEHEELFPASTTKIMTLLLSLEALQKGEVTLEDKVPVTEHAASMGGTQLFLSPGDVVDLESLLIGVTVGSANDASVAVAEYIAGSEESFVRQMNKRAKEIGVKNTKFVNSSGLHHDEHYSSAYDLSLMAKELLSYPIFFQWSTIWMDENFLKNEIKSGKVFLSNTNRMVRLYSGCDGVKTGFTSESGHSVVATAGRNGTRFIAAALAAPSSESRYEDAAALLNYGFDNYKSVHIADKHEKVAAVPVEKGKLQEIYIITAEKMTILVEKEKEPDYEVELVYPEKLSSPICSDKEVGQMKVVKGEQVEKSIPLKPIVDVEKASFHELFFRYFNKWLRFGH